MSTIANVDQFKSSWIKHFIGVLCCLTFIYMLYAAVVGPYRTTVVHLALFLGAMLSIYFLTKSAQADRQTWGKRSLDYGFAIVTAGSLIYFIVNFERLINLWGASYLTTSDLVVGSLLVLVVLEAARRESVAFAVLSALAIAYVIFGNYIPGILGHAGIPFDRFIFLTAYTSEGIFGIGLSVAASYLFMFLLLSSAMEYTKTGDLIVGLCNAGLGHKPGGPAKSAVAASSLLGMMMGSSIGNVVTTGTFTIPLMKRCGLPAHKAGAIETISSEGSQFLPPIMGAGAFLMAEFTGIPYASIALAATIPALLYYISVFTVVHIESKKLGLGRLNEEDIPSARQLLMDGWHLLVAPLLLIYLLIVEQLSPNYAGMITLIVSVAIAMLRRHSRLSPSGIYSVVVTGVLRAAQITALIAAIGFIQQAMVTTGLGPRLTEIILSLGDGTLLITLILSVCVSTLLGMGMPTSVAYVMLALFVAPALQELGVPVLAAHLFVYYFAIKSGSTPPVAVVAVVAASIAHANWWKTGVAAFTYSLPSFIVAFMFIYSPELLAQGEWLNIIVAFITAGLGVMTIALGLQGWCLGPLTGLKGWLLRVGLLCGAGLLVKSGVVTDVLGISLIAAMYGCSWFMRRQGLMPVTANSGV